jgi:hypothetical protein
MYYCAQMESGNLKQTNVPTLYEKIPVHGTVPVTEKHILALFNAEQALKDMTGLSVIWEDLGAEPPNDEARVIAKSLLVCTYASGLEPTVVTASSDSGIAICFKKNGVYADLECFNSGEIASAAIDRQGKAYTWEIDQEQQSIIKAIDRIKQFLNA